MIQDETVKKLMEISVARTFKPQEYICYEGQPGEEMYIVLKGTVGVYVSNDVGAQIEVARVEAGDLFGEMAVFDSLPRSASCIALDEVICVAIGKDNLSRLVSSCPDIAIKILENMSGRIRRLNVALYKHESLLPSGEIPDFEVPSEYCYSHEVEEPDHDLNYTESITSPCPICGKNVIALNLKRKSMSLRKQRNDGRVFYKECEPLWYDIWVCPYCHYSNHYRSFFVMNPFKMDLIQRVLTEKHEPVMKEHADLESPFDQLFIRYIRAIHINRTVDPENDLLIGRLWLNLYWLFEDSDDKGMWFYSARKAIEYLSKAVEKGQIPDEHSLHSIELTLASLHVVLDNKPAAIELCERVLKYNDNQLKKFAYEIRGNM